MPENRILPLVGGAATLYLIADAYVRGGSFSPLESFVALLAALISLAPLFAQRLRRERARTHRAFTWLTATLALTTGSTLGGYELYQIIGSSSGILAAGFLLDLALSEPDRIPGHARLRLLNFIAFALLFGLNLVARTEFEGALATDLLLPSHFEIESGEILLLSASLALLLRIARKRLGSTPQALAANAWGVLALGLAVPFLIGEALLRRGAPHDELRFESPAFLLALAAAGLSLGHLAVFLEERRLISGASLRRILAFALPLLFLAGAAALIAGNEGYDPLQAAAITAGIILGSAALDRLLRRPIRRLFAPNAGRLLEAIDEAFDAIEERATLDELAQAALAPLRDHHAAPSPLLVLLEPARVYRLDAAGIVRSDDRALPSGLSEYLDGPAEDASSPLFRHELEARAVRDARSRPLLDALRGYEADVLITCPADGENQGALLFAASSLGLPHSMEELRALRDLGARIGARIVAFQAARRSTEHIHQALLKQEALEVALRELQEKLRTLELTAYAPPGRGDAPLVAYSPAMRAALDELDALGEGPIALHTPPGGPDKALAREAYLRSGGRGPFIIFEPGAEKNREGEREDPLSALVGRAPRDGSPGAFGALARAHGGTLFIRSLDRLERRTQRVLSEALRERRYRAVGGAEIRPLELRLIVSVNRPLIELERARLLDAELAHDLRGRELRIPRLEERAEDLDSLILLAIDYAAEALGKESPGLFEETAAMLRRGPFLGDERGLRWRLYAAVALAPGNMLEPSALSPLGEVDGGASITREPPAAKRVDAEPKAREQLKLPLKNETAIEKSTLDASETAPNQASQTPPETPSETRTVEQSDAPKPPPISKAAEDRPEEKKPKEPEREPAKAEERRGRKRRKKGRRK